MKRSKELLIITGVLILLLIVFAMGNYDYVISRAIINKHSNFGEFFNRYGEFPAMLGLLVGTAILFGARKKEVLWRNILGIIVSLPFMALFSYAVVFMPVNYAYEHAEGGIPDFMKTVVMVIAALLFAGALILIRVIGNEKLKSYRKHAGVIISVIVLEVLIVNVLKILWARPRMRSIESVDQFKKWYEISGPSNDNELKSFPSGHTANGFAMIVYSMFIPANKKNLLRNFTLFAITWGVMVAVSRVILGAHFLSDVAVGGYVTILLFYLIQGLAFRQKSKAARSATANSY